MKLSHEEFATQIAAAAVSNLNRDRSPIGVINAAVGIIKTSFPELLATLPSEQEWATSLAAWARLNIPVEASAAASSDIFCAEAWLETGLLMLIDAGTLVPVITTNESLADLAKLRKTVKYHNLLPQEAPAAVVQAVPKPVAVDPIDQCVTDYRVLHSTEFRKRWMTGDALAIYERACAEGRL